MGWGVTVRGTAVVWLGRRGRRLVGRAPAANRGPSRGHDCDRGAGTVLALALVTVLGSLITIVSTWGQVVVARHRAAAAADLAALAAAGVLNGAVAGGAG